MRIDILTLFPKMFTGILQSSILNIAIQKKLVDIRITDFRNFSYERHRNVDDTPYGGGPGMLLKPEPIFRAVESIYVCPGVTPLLLLTTPQGIPFNQKMAWDYSKQDHIIIICGHYEGFDERIRIGLKPTEVSIGDYVLTGGEIPAMVLLDSIVRLLPGTLGDNESSIKESFYDGKLEYPQYTRPLEWRGMKVPEILYSGHHANIQKWQEEMSIQRTKERRPDLLATDMLQR
ncbi:MAG: tRNA (guanosine(37)-N1)-methyltransferase TrmD [Planctomycetes bacterium]|nr:tRNA (guanosine(37)-N1)-methyltransferase TrmD [Planctomycetota bacterium]HNZ66101.1 tRNA (guanosine(37)-N1)-methyltransferase TrmD [Planctomycetota bacterium]HPY75285.1 tRNA (guanosine(37)-N1)-methyltransferase TrmD [Planctomycetota bacterium]HQB00940.1 tRNA (guanosine(37)-N1)-methyltransferase TrmD [Planctomycetota bacterium]